MPLVRARRSFYLLLYRKTVPTRGRVKNLYPPFRICTSRVHTLPSVGGLLDWRLSNPISPSKSTPLPRIPASPVSVSFRK